MMEFRGENLLPWPIYKPYFFLEQSNISGTSYKVYCLLCYPSKKILSTSRCSASNLLRHMRKLHPTEVPKLKITGPGYKKSIPVKRKISNEHEQASEEISLEIQDVSGADGTVAIIPETSIEKRDLTMDLSTTYHEEYVTQHKVDQLIIDFIVNGLHSPSLVGRPEFQNLIAGLQPERTIMNKSCIENIIADNANSFKRQLRDILAEVPHIATTADAWRVYNRCYIGITAHWLDPDTLDRRSAVLACRTTVGAHTYIEVTRVLDEVHEEFGIQNKITQITTDNGFNFTRSSRVFRFDTKDDAEDVETNENDFEFVELTPILDSEGEETHLYNIPPHERCIVHTMYLLATEDTKKAEDESLYKQSMKDAMSRAQCLWKAQTSNLRNVEFVKEKLPQLLSEPKNNWTSQFEALKHLQQVFKDKMDLLNEVCDALEIPRFRDMDRIFIEEYCRVMKPVAAAIDALRSEKNAFMGILLPVLHALSRRLVYLKDQATQQDELILCYPLLEAVIDGIEKRFATYMFRRNLVLAAAFHPEFQLTWLKDPEQEKIAKDCLKESVREISMESENSPLPASEEDDELFDFKKPTASRNNNKQLWENEVDQFLTYSTGQIKCLHSYPLIKDLFIQYNTALPSSAAAEKTFSILGDFFVHKNGFLPDLCCEDMLLVKTGIR